MTDTCTRHFCSFPQPDTLKKHVREGILGLPLAQHKTQSDLQTVKKGSWGQLHFKGDPIDRPPTSREWPWLMHHMVALSKWANARLGLDKPPDDGEIAETHIKVS